MISPETFEKEGKQRELFHSPLLKYLLSCRGSNHNWPHCDWLCRESISLLPTKTHRSLDITGSLGAHTCLRYNSRRLYLEKSGRSWEKFLLSDAFFFGLQMLILNKVTLHDWKEGIRGRFSQNLKVLPILKLSVKPNKPFECTNKENSKKRQRCWNSGYGRQASPALILNLSFILTC